jgi:hypothetical protein
MCVASLSAAAGPVPFDPQPAVPYQVGMRVPDGMARIRLDLTSNEDAPSAGVGVGAVTFCTRKSCFRAVAQSVVDLSNTASGKSVRVLDAVIPTGKIERLFFDDIAGRKVVAGSIHFGHPIPLEDGFQGSEIMVVLDRAVASDRTVLKPVAAAGNYFRDGGEVVYYNPRFRTVARIGHLASLDIPSGATAQPQVFSVAAHDIGEDYPLVDIHPVVALDKPATVRLDPTPHAPSDSVVRASVAGPLPVPARPRGGDSPPPPIDLDIPRTGVIHPVGTKAVLMPGEPHPPR